MNPEANFDVLKNPTEPHFWKSHGMSCLCNFAAAATGTAEKDRTAKGSLMENKFFLTLETMFLQIVEFGDTLCIVGSGNEEKKRALWNRRMRETNELTKLVKIAFQPVRLYESTIFFSESPKSHFFLDRLGSKFKIATRVETASPTSGEKPTDLVAALLRAMLLVVAPLAAVTLAASPLVVVPLTAFSEYFLRIFYFYT